MDRKVWRALEALKIIEDKLREKCPNEFGTHGAKLLTDMIREALPEGETTMTEERS